jgi:hypothetical protein
MLVPDIGRAAWGTFLTVIFLVVLTVGARSLCRWAKHLFLRLAEGPRPPVLPEAASMVLYEKSGPTDVCIRAGIMVSGGLQLSGQDLGKAPQACFGDPEYEYFLEVPAEHKLAVIGALLDVHASQYPAEAQSLREEAARASGDASALDALLLRLLGARYRGNARVVSEFMALLKSRSIPHRFSSF